MLLIQCAYTAVAMALHSRYEFDHGVAMPGILLGAAALGDGRGQHGDDAACVLRMLLRVHTAANRGPARMWTRALGMHVQQ